MNIEQKQIYDEVVRLGPGRMCEWVTRSRPGLVEHTSSLVQRARTLLYPALAGAYHDGFKSLSVLPHYVNLAFLEDIVEGDYPEAIKEAAVTALRLVEDVLRVLPSADAYSLYEQAMFVFLIKIRAIGRVQKAELPGVRECSLNLSGLMNQIMKAENIVLPPFPVLIWAGNLKGAGMLFEQIK